MGIAAPVSEPEPQHYEVWPEHRDAVQTFIRCGRQWRPAPSRGVFGLDYNVVFKMMDLYHVEDQTAVLEDLQVIEDRAAELINQKAREEANR